MPQEINILLQKYISMLRDIYKSHLCKVMLYGSYARGDFTQDSDIDIIILLNISDMELKKFDDSLYLTTYDFNEKYNIDISPYAKCKKHFDEWSSIYPFYRNIVREGVILYE